MIGIDTGDGLRLEAEWTSAAGEPLGVVVLCHAHPRHGGTMRNPLMRSVARSLGRSGLHVLRFNFRGVGHSQGAWGGGEPEVDDVAAAMAAAAAAHPGLPLGIAGWSFGAVAALRWQANAASTLRYAGISPAIGLPTVAPPREALAPADRLLVIGDRDQFTPVSTLAEYATSIGARYEVMAGSDHFFYFRHDRVGALVAAHLGGRTEDG